MIFGRIFGHAIEKENTGSLLEQCVYCGGIFHHRREVLEITWQLQAAEVLSKLSTMNDKSSFVKVPLVITKQPTLYFKQFFKNTNSGSDVILISVALNKTFLKSQYVPLHVQYTIYVKQFLCSSVHFNF
jgi:hypothetical protein